MSRRPLLAGVVVLACLAGGAPLAADDPKGQPLKLVTHKVKREKLQPQIIERGTLESVNSSDIYCEVRSGQRGSLAATAIKRLLVEDGDKVKKGQLLIELDSSGLEDQLRTEQITRDRNAQEVAHAADMLSIQKSQNESDLSTAELNVKLATIDLEKYQKADRDQTLQDIKARLLQAEADAEQWAEALDQAEAKLKQKEATDRQVRVVRLRLEAARLALARSQQELQAFEKYGGPRTESDLRGKVAEATQGLERVRQQARAKEHQANQILAACKSIHEQQLARCKGIEEEMKKCKILAPQDGMVVYYVPEQARGGAGVQQAIIAQGEPVREGQKLMSIPDLSKMQVVINVPEPVIAQIRSGMAAQLRAEAFPDQALRGTISRIATIPSARDFLSFDEKVYRTVFAIEGDTIGLRPGMSVTVTMSISRPLDNVLTVPGGALIGRGGFGRTVSCLVLTADGPEEREIVVGHRNQQIAEIVSGLREGDAVIVNPQLLLNDVRDRIRFLRSGKLPPRRGE